MILELSMHTARAGVAGSCAQNVSADLKVVRSSRQWLTVAQWPCLAFQARWLARCATQANGNVRIRLASICRRCEVRKSPEISVNDECFESGVHATADALEGAARRALGHGRAGKRPVVMLCANITLSSRAIRALPNVASLAIDSCMFRLILSLRALSAVKAASDALKGALSLSRGKCTKREPTIPSQPHGLQLVQSSSNGQH
eukprot:1250748-Prymnesium_polylepis.1